MRVCHGCLPPERTSTCHITCPKYIAEFESNNERREKQNASKQEHYRKYYDPHIVQCMERERKKKRH